MESQHISLTIDKQYAFGLKSLPRATGTPVQKKYRQVPRDSTQELKL